MWDIDDIVDSLLLAGARGPWLRAPLLATHNYSRSHKEQNVAH